MKIGIVTFWYGDDNYGMIMQCWALQTFLRKEGHDSFVVKYNPIGSPLKRLLKKFATFCRSSFNKKSREIYVQELKLEKRKKEKDSSRDFSGFRREHIIFSEYSYYNMSSLRANSPDADAYIAGSDQIWRSSLRYWSTEAFFLQFGGKNIRRIAYAPSFGLKKYPSTELPMLSSALSHFDNISCREYDGVKICNDAGFEATKVLDPTLLLSASDYYPLLSENKYFNYIFIYSLNISQPSDIYFDSVKDLFLDKEIVVTPSSGYIQSSEIFGDDVKYDYARPQDWLSLIRKADLVITSSFHGVVFAIIFKTKFAYVPLKGQHTESNNRVLDLLMDLDMNYAIINDGTDYTRINNIDYNWDKTYKLLLKQIDASKLFLKNSLR